LLFASGIRVGTRICCVTAVERVSAASSAGFLVKILSIKSFKGPELQFNVSYQFLKILSFNLEQLPLIFMVQHMLG